jgi:hypothetical protein
VTAGDSSSAGQVLPDSGSKLNFKLPVTVTVPVPVASEADWNRPAGPRRCTQRPDSEVTNDASRRGASDSESEFKLPVPVASGLGL